MKNVESPEVEIDSAMTSRLVSAAMEASPRECCGVLVGHSSSIGCQITGWREIVNSAAENHAFRIDPRLYRDIEKDCDANQVEIVGIVHSHPFSAGIPSLRDLREARRLFPQGESWVYAICGLKEKEGHLRFWRLRNGAFAELSLRLPS